MTTKVRTRETQGRCHGCNVRYVWQGKPQLKDAICPVHRTPLSRTTYLTSARQLHVVGDDVTAQR